MVFVIFVLLVEVGFFIIIALHYDQGRSMLKDHLISQMKNYDHLHPSSYEQAVDAIQNRVGFFISVIVSQRFLFSINVVESIQLMIMELFMFLFPVVRWNQRYHVQSIKWV